jgi:hypothetical protein
VTDLLADAEDVGGRTRSVSNKPRQGDHDCDAV